VTDLDTVTDSRLITKKSTDRSSEKTIVNHTTSLCPQCKNAIDATIYEYANHEVWMHKHCATHGDFKICLSDNATWYKNTRSLSQPTYPQHLRPPLAFSKQQDLGCPFDCGPCTIHQQKTRLPIVTITSACNLDCPKCYVHNKNSAAYYINEQEFEDTLTHIIRQNPDAELLNITGGEPTLHPQFLQLIEMCRTKGFRRVSVCTNGILLANDENFLRRFAELGGRVALSFDSFDDDANYKLNGSHLLKIKTRCMDLLEKYNVGTTLIPVISKGINDHEIGDIVRYAFSKKNLRHIELHTITFTGPGGSQFDRNARINMHEVLTLIDQQCDGLITKNDFVPSPCAHPLCYQIAYFLCDPKDGTAISFSRFLDKQTIYDCLTDSLYLEPSARLQQALQQAMSELWVKDDEQSLRILGILKHALDYVFPSDRAITHEESLRRSEELVKAIYLHSHMDEENFDVERIAQCCDADCYPDGSSIPVCAYNILYRDKEEHFKAQPLQWHARQGGAMKIQLIR